MAGKNTAYRGTPKSIFNDAKAVVTSAVSINQGDFVVFNDTSNILALPAAEAEGSTFLGVMPVTIVNGHMKDVYVTDVDASVAITSIPGPTYGMEFKVILKTGVSISPGDLVYLDPATGTRGVTNTGTKAIGIYQGAAVASAPAGTEIICLIGARHPADALKF